jgi:Ca-activated chloride channel family protein
MDPEQAAELIEELGVQYQLVTDETSMILLSDETFDELGIDPSNRDRATREEEARMLRDLTDPVDHSVTVDDGFTGDPVAPTGAPTLTGQGSSRGGSYGGGGGYGGGAVDGDDAGALLLLGLALWLSRRSRRGADA